MARRHRPATKAQLLARMPRGLRPKLPPDQLRQVSMCHVQTLDAIATGQGDETLLWDFAEGVLTWALVAQQLGVGELEMQGQHQVLLRLIDRWERTGRVAFDGPDYQMAKLGVAVMDQLAAETDTATATQAAIASTLAMDGLKTTARRQRVAQEQEQHAS